MWTAALGERRNDQLSRKTSVTQDREHSLTLSLWEVDTLESLLQEPTAAESGNYRLAILLEEMHASMNFKSLVRGKV